MYIVNAERSQEKNARKRCRKHCTKVTSSIRLRKKLSNGATTRTKTLSSSQEFFLRREKQRRPPACAQRNASATSTNFPPSIMKDVFAPIKNMKERNHGGFRSEERRVGK